MRPSLRRRAIGLILMVFVSTVYLSLWYRQPIRTNVSYVSPSEGKGEPWPPSSLATSTTAGDGLAAAEPNVDETKKEGDLKTIRSSEGASIDKGDRLMFQPLSRNNMRFALFATFPNSGTTYTLGMVGRYTNTATFYISSVDPVVPNKDGRTDAHLFRKDMIRPFSLDPFDPFRRLVPPHQHAKLILVKTHCDGVPFKSTFERPNPLSFFKRRCWTKNRKFRRGNVHAMVHIARDPLNNIVARSHWVAGRNATSSVEGFRSWCADINREAFGGNLTTIFNDGDVIAILKRIPCAPVFHAYFVWHEHAFALADSFMNERGIDKNNNNDVDGGDPFPVLRFHYEDYATKWNETATNILDLLGVSPDGFEPAPFHAGKTYHDYYTADERQAVKELFYKVATPRVIKLLGRYFEE